MTDIAHNVATETNGGVELSRSLKSRHVSMIAIGGIIGAGLFVGSSTTISRRLLLCHCRIHHFTGHAHDLRNGDSR